MRRAGMLVMSAGVLVGAFGFASVPAIAAAPAATKAKAVLAAKSPEDIDLWTFMAVDALAPGKAAADFRALPNFAEEARDDLRGDLSEPQAEHAGPSSLRMKYSDGMELRLLDYGTNAFVTRLRVDGQGHAIKDALRVGDDRSAIEQELGRPTRGGMSYVVYEGKNDVLRVYYTPEGKIRAVEIDRGG